MTPVSTVKATQSPQLVPDGLAHARSAGIAGSVNDDVLGDLEAMAGIKSLLARVGELGKEPEGDDSAAIARIEAYLGGRFVTEGEPSAPARNTDGSRPDAESEDAAPPRTALSAAAMFEAALAERSVAEEPEDTASGQRDVALPKSPEPSAPKEKNADTIRVPVAALQRIGDLVSELVLTRNQILQLSRQHTISQIKNPLERLSTVTSDLQDAVMRARMQPMTRLFASVPRLLRDLSVKLKKTFDLTIEGADTELDRQLIEAIRDPLIHLILNCADHGIEDAEERLAAGKPEAGQISISAFCDAVEVTIEVADDGRGLDAARIRKTAVERGLVSPEIAADISDEDLYRFILEPGFSTASAVTTVSGRGVGLDVVRAKIEGAGGTIWLYSTKGWGSRFILKIPLNLAIVPALIVKTSGQRFALPQHSIMEAVHGNEAARNVKTIDNAQVLQLRRETIPVASLSELLGLPESGHLEDKLVIVLAFRGKKLGVIVDDIEDIQEIVVKPLGALFSNLKMFSGSAILGDDSVILILDPAGIAATMTTEHPALPQSQVNGAARKGASLILFKAGAGTAKVLPRAAVSRIVRVQADELREADGLALLRYEDRFIPVLSVAGAGPFDGACLVLVVTLYHKTFGLCVDSVLDIVESETTLQLISSSPWLLGTADMGGETVEFIDAGYYYRMAFQEQRPAARTKANVLIVGGEPGTHDMLTPLLASAGHEVTAVATAQDANTLLSQTVFGVILLDPALAHGIDDNALSQQSDALCLVFAESDRETTSSNSVSTFDRRDLLAAIDSHLGAPVGGGEPVSETC